MNKKSVVIAVVMIVIAVTGVSSFLTDFTGYNSAYLAKKAESENQKKSAVEYYDSAISYFDEKDIREALANRLNDEAFKSDLQARHQKLTEHELLSAYVAVCVYKDALLDQEINWTLLVRMIIG